MALGGDEQHHGVDDDPNGIQVIQEEESANPSDNNANGSCSKVFTSTPNEHDVDSTTRTVGAHENDHLPPRENTPLRCGFIQNKISVFYGLALGQGIALIATCMNATSFTLIHKFDVQTQLFWVYVFMSFHLFVRMDSRPPDSGASDPRSYTIPWLPLALSPRLLVPWWIYLGMSILDVFPNFLTLVSFQYTSLTSTTLLGSLTVPATMMFSKLILSKTFRVYQYVGVAVCVAGGVLTIYIDASSLNHRPHSYIGDLMAISAAVAYGLGDTVAEYSVKRMDRFEYLGMLGFFGVILTGCSFPFIEWNAILSLLESLHHFPVFGLLALYICSVLAYYMTAAKFLVTSDATLLNLSMQSVNLWAILFTWISGIGEAPPRLFYASLVTVVAGVFVYELGFPCSNKRFRSGSSNGNREESCPPVDYQTLAQRSIV